MGGVGDAKRPSGFYNTILAPNETRGRGGGEGKI